ncbi:MAG: hypothetical protein OES09_06860 [Gammaproteobacteria bacterium]|nr:hypothetical protein [Gammaproteobacteria bacterium]
MVSPGKIFMQAIAYAGFAALIGYFSASPEYAHMDPKLALIKLSFSHAGAPKTECRKLGQEELNELPPNMRRLTDCPRERVALLVELDIDGVLVYRDWRPPSGVAGDGASAVYERFPVQPGRHKVTVRLRDSRKSDGFDWEYADAVEIKPRQNFVIDFRAETGGFKFL